MSTCPVCHSAGSIRLLDLERWPLFQHPTARAEAIEPVYCDLRYQYCPDCGHAFQRGDYRELLEEVYCSHYYTPADSNLGCSFRRRFLEFLSESVPELGGSRRLEVLEIGSSFGAMLQDLRRSWSGHGYTGFEPNRVNAGHAQEAGIETVRDFFGVSSAAANGKTYDVIFSRHVIEHVFDFDDFLGAVDAAARENAVMLVETPSLDRHLELASIDPFHVEHVHVFSLSSLTKLCGRYGWYLRSYRHTPAGNVIARFDRKAYGGEQPAPPDPTLASRIEERLRRWRTAIVDAARGRPILVWGAGSFGLCLVSLLGLRPALFLDGNRNKEGLRYVGVDLPIRHGPPFVADLVNQGEEDRYLMVVASTYHEEIRGELTALGWRGEVVALPEVA